MRRHVSDLLRTGAVVVYTSAQASVAEAVEKMTRHNVGSILVMKNNHQLVGIFTERDLLHRVAAKNLNLQQTKIGDVMTSDVIVVSSDTPRGEVRRLMDTHHIRHIPVSDGKHIIGVISLRDVLRFENAEKEFEIEQLRHYIHQPGPNIA
ncbi:MAG: CBS domain-containing protein [Rhodothermales bacterium]